MLDIKERFNRFFYFAAQWRTSTCPVASLFLCLLVALSTGCTNSAVDPDEDEEGGIIGTGLYLQGTVTDVRSFARNAVDVRARSGEQYEAAIDSMGQYQVADAEGNGPYLLRVDFGNEEYRYGIAFDSGIANVNSYSDVILRNWFASRNGDIDVEYGSAEIFTALPSREQFNENSRSIFALVELVLDAYELSGTELLSTEYNSVDDQFGIHTFLQKNTAFIKNEKISLVITDPETNTQSTTLTDFDVFEGALQDDLESPSAPLGVKAVPSATNEVVLVWDPSSDNRGVVGYDVFRDGELIKTTPFPVYTDTGLNPALQYAYEVIAFDAADNRSVQSSTSISGTLGKPDVTAPPAPVRLSATADKGRIDLIWGQTSIADVVSFDVFRGSTEDAPSYLTSVTSSVMTDVTVMSGVEYCYQVVAVDASGNESLKSEIDCSFSDGDIVEVVDEDEPRVPPLAGLTIPDVHNLECDQEFDEYLVDRLKVVDAGCYLVMRDIKVAEGGSLSFGSGVILMFAAGRELRITAGASLTANGSKDKPVVFTGIDPIAGFWDGLVFRESNSSKNILNNVVVEFAGAGQFSAAVSLTSGGSKFSSVEITSAVIRDCVGTGLLATSELARIRNLDFSLITNCDYPFVGFHTQLTGVSQKNDFSGNLHDVISLGNVVISSDTEIRDLGIPFDVINVFLYGANLTIYEGVEILFSANSKFFSNGTVQARGTDNNPIRFSGSVAVPGHWLGIDSM